MPDVMPAPAASAPGSTNLPSPQAREPTSDQGVTSPPGGKPVLAALPYHLLVRDHLKVHAAKLWEHFSSDAFQQAHAEELRLALLKATYRLDRTSHPELYAHVDACAAALKLKVPVELYQGPNDGTLNAALYFVPDTARVVLLGPIQELLTQEEIRALLGHELSHHVLWTLHGGELLATERALSALSRASDQGAGASVSACASERLFKLHTEVYADRGGMLAAGSRDATIRCVVKVQTGLKHVDATAYVAQADEVLAKDRGGSDGQTHPEAFLRAKALALYAAEGDASNAQLRALLEGPASLDSLDLLRRQELSGIVRDLIDLVLRPAWFQTEAVLAHARLMFDEYQVPDLSDSTVERLKTRLLPYDKSAREVLSWVLVDLVAVGADLAPLPLARCLDLAIELDLGDALRQGVNRELKQTKKAIAQVETDRARLLTEAAVQPTEGDDAKIAASKAAEVSP